MSLGTEPLQFYLYSKYTVAFISTKTVLLQIHDQYANNNTHQLGVF